MDHDVLHVLATNERRGAETFAYELHQEFGKRGLRSDICCVEPGSREHALPVPALAPRRFSLAGARSLRARAARARMVAAHGSSTLLACGLGLVGLRVPFVYLSIGDPRYWAGSRSRRLRARWLLSRAATVVAISAGARDVLVNHYDLAPEQVTVIPNGRSGQRFQPAGSGERTVARESLGIPPTGDVVAVIGALSPEKRVNVAIEAVARMSDAVLVLAGDGPERPTLEALAGEAAPGRVHFVGRMDGPEAVLAAADVVALSSDSEGVPGVLIEAGLAGLPVVATDVGWVRDVVVDGRTGLIIPPGRPDLLAAALRQAFDRRAEFGGAARAHCVAEFEMGQVANLWRNLIERVGSPTK